MICSELYDERHGRIPPSEMSFKQADSYVPPDSGLRGYAVDRHVHRPVCPGMDCIVQPMCYDQSLNRRRSHAALSVRWDEQNESTWDWSIRIASGERIDSKTSRSGRAWSCQSDFERQDASLTTGPTGRPFGGTSVYGPRVKRDLVKSRERDFLNMLANSPRAVFSDFCVTNRHSVDVEAFCIYSKSLVCPVEEGI